MLEAFPKPALEEAGIHRFQRGKRHRADRDLRGGVIIPRCQKTAPVVENLHEAARSRIPLHTLNLAFVNPRMTLFQPLFAAALQYNRCHDIQLP
ncbi:hypothetical protein D1872_254830 [compost metagenome]